jgi:hypothetical protein
MSSLDGILDPEAFYLIKNCLARMLHECAGEGELFAVTRR